MHHLQKIDEVLNKLQTSTAGLSTKEVEKRLKEYGKNVMPKSKEKVTRFGIFLSQFKSPLMIILLLAGVISALLKEPVDATVIFITVFINSFIGFLQEDKANKALKRLSQMVDYKALVLRDGQNMLISAKDLVPGDILILDAGDKVLADARIIKETDLEIDESALTGESLPQKKTDKILKKEVALGDKKNMVFRGTSVVNGRARAVVFATGAQTEIGKIADLVKTTKDEKTPLQVQLSKLAKKISYLVLLICFFIFFIGIVFNQNGESVLHLFEIAVAVAVAAIPEGLVISLTVILAIGMQHILKRNSLIRRLVAAETLGSVSVICTDKTGTLTEGKMSLTRIVTDVDDLDFEEIKILNIEKRERHEDAVTTLKTGVLCNNGFFEDSNKKESEWKFVGDTTDVAFLSAGVRAGFDKKSLDKALPRVAEIPFDSRNKFMATLNYVDHESILSIKGAPDVLFEKCAFYEKNGKAEKMTAKKLAWFNEKEDELTAQGLRVLAVCYKRIEGKSKGIKDGEVKDLVLIGLVALSDPLREGVEETIKIAKQAGIKTIMITGDHVKTAQSIALAIGIPCKINQIFDGKDLENISDDKLRQIIKDLYVFARVDPKHKIRIVRALQENGEVVAMTGDGVNDAPALKGADIGVALGSGTDVAKEISDMVLLDNHYGTIVNAVEEGRGIYQNIKKVVLYLLSGSFAEAILIVGSIVAGMPLAALPAQILWVNLIEDAFPNIALAFDKGDKENMKDKPRHKDESIIDKEMKVMIIAKSILANILLFAIFVWFWKTTGDIKLTRTIVFVGFAVDSLFYVFAIRSLRHGVFTTNPFSNKYLVLAVGFGWAMLLLAIYWHPLQILLRTVPLNYWQWGIMISFGIFNLALIEIIKWIFIRRKYV